MRPRSRSTDIPDHEGHDQHIAAIEHALRQVREPMSHEGLAEDQPEHDAHMGVNMDLAVHGREVAHEGHAAGHAPPASHAGQEEHAADVDHTGHEQMFRRRFWVCLVLSIPVLLYSPMLQMWFNFSMPAFAGSQWIAPLFSVVVFLYGGVPFLQMAVPELRNRQPGMMTLISLAISVAFIYSLAALFISPDTRLLLGAGDADRHHAARPLDRDAQRAPGVRRAQRAGQADAGHRRAHPPGRQHARRWPPTSCATATWCWCARGRACPPTAR